MIILPLNPTHRTLHLAENQHFSKLVFFKNLVIIGGAPDENTFCLKGE